VSKCIADEIEGVVVPRFVVHRVCVVAASGCLAYTTVPDVIAGCLRRRSAATDRVTREAYCAAGSVARANGICITSARPEQRQSETRSQKPGGRGEAVEVRARVLSEGSCCVLANAGDTS
jgi:hypothetical protein